MTLNLWNCGGFLREDAKVMPYICAGLSLTFKFRKSRLPIFEIWKSHWIFFWSPKSRCGGLSNLLWKINIKISEIILPCSLQCIFTFNYILAGPHSAVDNVSGYRCVSDCRSGVASSIPVRSGPILSWRLIMKWFLQSFSSLSLIYSRRVVVSYKRKYVHELLVNGLFKPAQEKVWLGELTVPQWP